MTYDEAVAYIASLAPRGWRLGLDRMEEFARRASLLPSDQKFIHVAGTNGKGSTTAMIQSALVEQGFSTGAFFSPYVVEPRERVQLGREYISEAEMAEITGYLKPIGESLSETEFGGVTEFEFKTALGLECWKRNRCEFVALEVGLGGRLDATNIITPACSAVVSIGLDHVSILGNTVEEIAFEKAGVLKPGRPAVIGEMAPGPLQVTERQAAEVGASIWRLGIEVRFELLANGKVRVQTPTSEIELEPSLFGAVQHHNAAVAYACLELAGAVRDHAAVQKGFSTAAIPGRYQRLQSRGAEWVFDGAHNPPSAKVLAAMLHQDQKQNLICITGMLQGHDPEEFYPRIAPFVKEFWVIPVDNPRSMTPTELSETLAQLGLKTRTFDSTVAAIEAAGHAEDTEGYLVSGSFYAVGEIMRLLRSAR
ncbi:MAG: folylpolyglutamate synthase/dihydrofolate synthase family protein [Armatimonadota bacterium]